MRLKHYEVVDLPHAVYRLFAADKTLLYVGMSRTPMMRLGHHGAEQPWMREITNITIEWYPDWAAGRRAEAAAILGEDPRYNRARTPVDRIGRTALRLAAQRPRGDGTVCPRCGNKKEVVRPGKAYCKPCYTEYRRELRLKKVAAGETVTL